MPGTSRLKGAAASFAVIAVIAVIAAIGIAVCMGWNSFMGHRSDAVRDFFRAVGSGDSPAACALLSDKARAKLMAERNATTCEIAVESLTSALTPAQRDSLVEDDLSIDETVVGDGRTEVTLNNSPLGTNVYVLYDIDGRQTITDWGWDARKIS